MIVSTHTLCIYLAAVNAVTFGLYGFDKRAAGKDRWRISEGTLLLFALAGGSPAAFAAMRYFRHKTRKASFAIRYWAIVILQVAALIYGWRHR